MNDQKFASLLIGNQERVVRGKKHGNATNVLYVEGLKPIKNGVKNNVVQHVYIDVKYLFTTALL
ncbi:hypothetical protein L0P88_06860 [Muricauda sp. SCSIO 64092]|uniref:hypothetical protein n=1 Tax=Allomuricauda sp. SCSIO 64092 TaxID=2908842 RepID=UPI001FF3339B|nr:hypothetical protein [Muricauda sp. SCSIO 64092]UOY08266.1 hypothetical protein L0P88_06860 [Muricauda sp. SCSIO 64092]